MITIKAKSGVYTPEEVTYSELAFMLISEGEIYIEDTRFVAFMVLKEAYYIHCEYADDRPSWTWSNSNLLKMITYLEREILKEIKWQEVM